MSYMDINRPDVVKLTKSQRSLLSMIRSQNDFGHTVNKSSCGGNGRTYSALEKAGLITSAKPFASAYHTVTITDAGRVALTGKAAE